MKGIPFRWSISCCSTIAKKSSASISISSPFSFFATTFTFSALGIVICTPGKLRHPSVDSTCPSFSTIFGFIKTIFTPSSPSCWSYFFVFVSKTSI